MKKIVLLDIDDTILDFKACERNAIQKTMEKYGVKPNNELVEKYSKINKSLWELFEKKEITKAELLVRRFEMFFHPLGVFEKANEINKNYLNYLSGEVFFVKDAVEFCKKLKEKCKVYVVTNGVKSTQVRRLDKSMLLEYFDDVFISEDVGYQKPDVRFFEYVYDRIGMPKKDEMIILGDSKTSDIQGGINFGITTCWFNKYGFDKYPNVTADYEIDKLMDFFKVIN